VNSTLKSLLFWMVLVVILVLIWQFSNALTSTSTEIAFSEFIDRVEQGDVVDAQFTGSQITGKLKTAIEGNAGKGTYRTTAPASYDGLANYLLSKKVQVSARPETAGARGRVPIHAGTKVFDVIQSYPETTALFREFGFTMIDNPVAQRVFARSISLEQACRLKHVDFPSFTAALRGAVEKHCAQSDDLIRIKSLS